MLDPSRELRAVHVYEVFCRHACPVTAALELGHDRRSGQPDVRASSGARIEVERLGRRVSRARIRTRLASKAWRLDPAVRIFRWITGADEREGRARNAHLAQRKWRADINRPGDELRAPWRSILEDAHGTELHDPA